MFECDLFEGRATLPSLEFVLAEQASAGSRKAAVGINPAESARAPFVRSIEGELPLLV